MNFISFLIFLQLCLFTQAANETHYIGAVVEFAPTIGDVYENAELISNFIKEAKEKEVDIIVFPEIGLNGYGTCLPDMLTLVPDPEDKIDPCTSLDHNYTVGFTLISCAAKASQIYVVLNVAEIVPCEDCPRGYLKYNTNVVFDRSGIVIARYRKFNLFGEEGTNVTSQPDLTYFDTDFGVRFATFICFDILFETPTLKLIREMGIKHIVYSTAWFSELPFLTANQAQQGLAYAEDVTFLASGYNSPMVGSGGSGIYVGKNGPLVSVFPDQETRQLIYAAIPINGGSVSVLPEQDHKAGKIEMKLKRENLAAYVSAPLEDLKSGVELCHGSFCCHFSMEVTQPTEEVSYHYRGLVFDGVRTFDGVATGGIQACAITTCESDDVISCGTRVTPKHVFSAINITGSFNANHSVQIPSTLVNGKQLLPLDSDQFSYDSNCDETNCIISITLTQPQNNLITFGIYGRDFTKDGQPVTPSEASIYSYQLILMSVFVLLTMRFS